MRPGFDSLPARHHWFLSLLRFAGCGTMGFIADVIALHIALDLGAGYFLGRLCSYLFAATVTWLLNRHITFRISSPLSISEWLRFIAANATGGMVNLSVYSALVAATALARDIPALAIAAGSIVGLLVNFAAIRRFVFGGRS